MIYYIKNRIRQFSYQYNILSKLYIKLNTVKTWLFSVLNDENFAKIKYKENTGKKLNLKNPTTFNEKLWWLKIHNRDPLLTKCSDKVKVREYVVEVGLEDILNEVYGIYDNAKDIQLKDLPEKAFIKVNHGSGTNVIWDKNKPINQEEFKKKFSRALGKNYYWQSREWNYKNIEPKIIIERILEDKDNISLIDYRFFCFDGKVKLVVVDIDTASEDGTHNPYAKRNVYNKEFHYLDIKIKREHFNTSLVTKPLNYDKMIEYAEILSEPFPFCRVDLYNVNGDIFFGEITFYPGGATQIIEPEEVEKKMGDWINLNSNKIIFN